MTSNLYYLDLAKKPAWTLSAAEMYAFSRYCDSHPEDISSIIKSNCPTADVSIFARPAEGTGAGAAPSGTPRLVYGLKGIEELFGCSHATAQRYLSSGRIDRAVSKIGRKVVVNADMALELLKAEKRKGWKVIKEQKGGVI